MSRTRSLMPSGSPASDSRADRSISPDRTPGPVTGVPGAGQAQRLRALAHADVEHAQPLPHGEARGYLLVELPGDQLLADRVAQSAEPAQPLGGHPREAGGLRAQGRSPRLTCGLGRRSRRIWSVRIRP